MRSRASFTAVAIALFVTACAAPPQDEIGQAQGAAGVEEGRGGSALERQVKHLVAEQLGLPLSEVTLASALVADLQADELDLVELAMGVEDEWGILIPDEESEKWVTVGDIYEYVVSHRRQG